MVSETLLDQVACEVRLILRRSGLERTLAIGALVVDRFFGGSLSLWRERRNHKNNSIRRLALHPECPLSRSSLNQAVGVYSLASTIPSIRALSNLEASHLGVVLPLPTPEQEKWLTQANALHWSVRQLKEAIQHARRGKGERRGRPRSTASRRALSMSRVLLERLATSVASLAELELDERGENEVGELRQRLAAVLDDLVRRSPPRAERRDSQVRFRTGPVASLLGDDEDTTLAS
jgi:hypothetical protein